MVRFSRKMERFVWLFLLLGGLLAIGREACADTVDGLLRQPQSLLQANCPSADSESLPKTFFTVCYNKSWRIARWVAYHLTSVDLEGDVDRTEDFREDKAIMEKWARSALSDYAGSGYHRGHMAPAETFDRSVLTMSTTFLLSNMAPQTPSLNSGKWRSLESQVRKVISGHRGVWIFTGNLFAKEYHTESVAERKLSAVDPMKRPRDGKMFWIGAGGRVAVPTHSFKAILVARSDGELSGFGFVLPNQRARLQHPVQWYQVPIDTIEELTELDFFSILDTTTQDRIERDTPAWPPKKARRL